MWSCEAISRHWEMGTVLGHNAYHSQTVPLRWNPMMSLMLEGKVVPSHHLWWLGRVECTSQRSLGKKFGFKTQLLRTHGHDHSLSDLAQSNTSVFPDHVTIKTETPTYFSHSSKAMMTVPFSWLVRWIIAKAWGVTRNWKNSLKLLPQKECFIYLISLHWHPKQKQYQRR